MANKIVYEDTNIYNDTAAILYLTNQSNLDDATTSSHWQNMHKDFKFVDGKYYGLKGFGEFTRKKQFIRRLIHKILKQKIIRLGSKYEKFDFIYQSAKQIGNLQGRVLCQDFIRQVITVSYLFKHNMQSILENEESTVLVIGDGWGSLSSLLLKCTKAKVVLVNLTKTLLIDLTQVQQALPETKFCLVRDARAIESALQDKSIRLIALRADDYNLLTNFRIDIAINIASMQEMNPEVSKNYIEILRKTKKSPTIFYCCNRKEKSLPDGTITRFSDYGWSTDDEDIDYGECPWHKEYYSLTPPFYRLFDGIHLHRLTKLRKA